MLNRSTMASHFATAGSGDAAFWWTSHNLTALSHILGLNHHYDLVPTGVQGSRLPKISAPAGLRCSDLPMVLSGCRQNLNEKAH